MAMWAASGIVMMYVAYPDTTNEERLASLAPIAMGECCAPFDASKAANRAAVEMIDGRPVLQLQGEGGPMAIDLRSGAPIKGDAASAARIAQAHLARTTGTVPVVTAARAGRDQWTVSGYFNAHAPYYKVRAHDDAGTELYISGVTGQVVQDTARWERLWNWLGAVPHWLYFKQLRADTALWTQVVVWGSLLGTFLTAVGLYIGIVQLGRGKRLIPYRGAAWWHHVTGLVFGVLTLTWVVSGLFSMNPWGMMESEGPGEEMTALTGREATGEDVTALISALASAPATNAVRAELSIQGGEPYAVMADKANRRWRVSLADLAPAPLSASDLDALGSRARKEPFTSALIRAEDAYHYAHHGTVVLPAWRVIYDNDEQTRLYFDPRTGELINFVDSGGRSFRWWHLALHRFDFAAGLRARPVWDVVVLPLMIGVTLLCFIGLWLGWKRLMHTFKRVGKTLGGSARRA
jgi:hypothetical protein